MSPIPKIPQPTPTLRFGDAIEGTEVIDADIEYPSDRQGGVQLNEKGRWIVPISGTPTKVNDLNDGAEFSDDGFRGAGAHLVRRMNKLVEGNPVRRKRHMIQVTLPEGATPAQVRSLVIGMVVGGHRFVTSNRRQLVTVRDINIVPILPAGAEGQAQRDKLAKAVEDGRRLGEATSLSRDLSNAPANVKSPEWFARRARKAVAGIPGVKVRVRDVNWLRDKKFGGILAVGEGSSRLPYLVELVWDPERVDQRRLRSTIALVGKGITFDTGGISIKPSAGMDLMRTDMTGGASIIAAFRALAQMQVPRKVVAVIPMAENMVSGSAYRPGDVVEHYGGITSEVSNTDAEGRMVLADAVSYVAKKHRPRAIVTIATLTGAAKLALGLRTGAVFSSKWSAGVKLARRGAVVGEQWWPLPQPKYLEAEVDSKIADVRQAPRGPGASTAAMFLRRFTRGVELIHLDIAGPGRADHTYSEVTPVGTGFGARTLVQWIAK